VLYGREREVSPPPALGSVPLPVMITPYAFLDGMCGRFTPSRNLFCEGTRAIFECYQRPSRNGCTMRQKTAEKKSSPDTKQLQDEPDLESSLWLGPGTDRCRSLREETGRDRHESCKRRAQAQRIRKVVGTPQQRDKDQSLRLVRSPGFRNPDPTANP